MANWLQKIRLPVASQQNGRNLTVNKPAGQVPAVSRPVLPQDKLPNASLIYGMAASGLFVVAIYFLFTGLWFTGALVSLPGFCFLGFSLYFLKSR